MRSIVFMHLTVAAITLASVASVAAQESVPAVGIAMDQPTADLWRLHFPDSKLDVVVRSDDEGYDTLNRRALLLRDVKRVFYRSDQHSLVSQLFLERISNQGKQSFDLAAHFRLRERASRRRAAPGPRGVALDRYGQSESARSAPTPLPSEHDTNKQLGLANLFERK